MNGMGPGFFHRKTIRSELFMVVLTINILTILLISGFYLFRLQSFVDYEIESVSAGAFAQTIGRLNDLYQRIMTAQRIVVSLANDSLILFKDRNILEIEILQQLSNERRLLTTIKSAFPFIDEIYIWSDDNIIVTNNTSVRIQEFLSQSWIHSNDSVKLLSHTLPVREIEYYDRNRIEMRPRMISYVTRASLFSDPNRTFYFQMDILEDVFFDILDSAWIESGLLIHILNHNNQLVISNQPSSDLLNNERYSLKYVKQSSVGTWEYHGWVNTNKFHQRFYQTWLFTLWISIIAVIVSLILAAVSSRKISKPLQSMINVMYAVGDGDFSQSIPDSQNIDLHKVSTAFNLMVQRVGNLLNQVSRKEKELSLAEFRALEAQINPHFLYNTLNTIQAMAWENPAVSDMIRALARLFRFSIDHTGDLVALKDEARQVSDFFFLQGHRFGGRIQGTIEIDPQVSLALVPRLLLQPLVENAYKHGLEVSNQRGKISVKAFTNDDWLHIVVNDDGVGMDVSILKSLQNSLNEHTAVKASDPPIGIGLANLHARLNLQYGSNYSIKIESKLRKGTTISLKIPLHLQENPNETDYSR